MGVCVVVVALLLPPLGLPLLLTLLLIVITVRLG
jgi:hypothetical protein